MLRIIAAIVAVCAVAGGILFFVLTGPNELRADVLDAMPEGDAGRGELVFYAGGCSSCHAADDAEGDEKLRLGGGHVLKSDFGDFTVPNISTDPEDGIGEWSREDFANALLRGVSPEGRHYYPSFPYTSYTRMSEQDVSDLWAFMQTLPAIEGKAGPHDLGFPFNVRRGVGLWKMLYLDDSPAVALDGADESVMRGQYLVEGPGHCGECHTPRNFAGGPIKSRWLAGAPAAEGDGRVPDITSGEGGIGSWSASDIAYYLESGFTPDFDSVGGDMVDVQENIAHLTDEDRNAIAAYLKAIPPQDAGS